MPGPPQAQGVLSLLLPELIGACRAPLRESSYAVFLWNSNADGLADAVHDVGPCVPPAVVIVIEAEIRGPAAAAAVAELLGVAASGHQLYHQHGLIRREEGVGGDPAAPGILGADAAVGRELLPENVFKVFPVGAGIVVLVGLIGHPLAPGTANGGLLPFRLRIDGFGTVVVSWLCGLGSGLLLFLEQIDDLVQGGLLAASKLG